MKNNEKMFMNVSAAVVIGALRDNKGKWIQLNIFQPLLKGNFLLDSIDGAGGYFQRKNFAA